MKPIATPKQALEIDSHMINFSKIPGILLMEQASTGVANVIMKMIPQGRILVLCGDGNNGGDGLALARILLAHGYDVHVACNSDAKRPPDSQVNYDFWANQETLPLEPHVVIDVFDVIVDAMFGVGLNKPLEGKYLSIAHAINECSAKVVAVDIPSGVFGKSGWCECAVRADVTVTFQHAKPGHLLYPGASYSGELHVIPIGVHNVKTDIFHYDVSMLPQRRRNSNKGTYGKAGIIAGSRGMAGAAVLATTACIRGGAGLTRAFACEYVGEILQKNVLEATVTFTTDEFYFTDMSISKLKKFLKCCSAFCIGPGLGLDVSKDFILTAISSDIPKVVDADALNLSIGEDFGKNTVVTPHPGEFSRMSGLSVEQILKDPLAHCKNFAREKGVVCLLKGASTVVSDGEVSGIVTAGSPGMAKGGSGDVLAGYITALLAQGFSPMQSTLEGALLCATAAEKLETQKNTRSMSAGDVLELL